eukprot:6180734-Pleurochrysis_carterae.AAC.2
MKTCFRRRPRHNLEKIRFVIKNTLRIVPLKVRRRAPSLATRRRACPHLSAPGAARHLALPGAVRCPLTTLTTQCLAPSPRARCLLPSPTVRRLARSDPQTPAPCAVLQLLLGAVRCPSPARPLLAAGRCAPSIATCVARCRSLCAIAGHLCYALSLATRSGSYRRRQPAPTLP